MSTTEQSLLEEDDLEQLQTLVDLFLDEEETKEEDDGAFKIFIRLASNPEFLVKGYDFEMLNKFVDFYTLPTHNLTAFNNATFHHSRLMGVSDIYNADSLLDVAIGLGAEDSKIILTGSAFGNVFNLLDGDKNMPGSSISGLPQAITYQQVCKNLQKGNWTLEREEDKTGPYAFNNKTWIAFDDDSSLKIKTKYAILRSLAGIGVFSVDADDLDDICGKGANSLVKSVHRTMTELDRQPRQLIVHSLEEDLYADAQNFVPVSTSAAAGINVSPFRIVRIVDREGQITSVRQNSETILECTRQGYYRHPEDCSRFYRCVKFNQYENDYTIFEYGCPQGLVFDDRWEVCVWPSQATPCDGSSEIMPVPRNDYTCPAEGYFTDPENCRWFFACLDHKGDGSFTHYEFRCPFGLAFDEEYLICNWPWLVPACGGVRSGKQRVLPGNRIRQQKAFGGVGRGRQPGGRTRPAGGNGVYNNGNQYTGGSGAYKSRNPARKPTNAPRYRQRGGNGNDGGYRNPSTPYTTVRPSYRRPTPSYPASGTIYGEVASESCENCESGTLTVRGNGHTIGAGIEVGAGVAFGNSHGGGYEEPRRPKANQYNPSTPAPAYESTTAGYNNYNPSTTAGYESYNPSTTAGYESYNPSTTAGYDSYNPSSTAGYDSYNPSTTAGYDSYNPSTTAGYDAYNPSTTAGYDSYNPSTTAGYNNPSTTAGYGSPSTTAGYNSPSSTAGYDYPVPANPLNLPQGGSAPLSGIFLSNPGENGLRPGQFENSPSSTYRPQTTPNTTPYAPSSYPTTPAPAYQPAYQSSTAAPAYQPSVQPAYQSTTERPSYPSTTRRPYPSTTQRPAYQSSTAAPAYPSTTRRPYPSTTAAPVYPSSTQVPNNYEQPQGYQPAYNGYKPEPQGYNPGQYQPEPQGYNPEQYQPAYNGFRPEGPNYRPEPEGYQPGYQTSDDDGYIYPVPENPLQLPEKRPAYQSTTARPYVPSTTRQPVYQSTTRQPVYQSTTRRPAYQPTTPRPTYPSTTRQPAYPSTTRRPAYPTTPAPLPAYGPSSRPAYNTTPRPTYPSTTARPVYQSTTQRPTYPSTTARPVYQSTTQRPTYPSTTRAPAYPSTTRRPSYPSPTPSAPAYQTEDESGYTYPVPANPLQLPERQPKARPGFNNNYSNNVNVDKSNFKAPKIEYGFRPPYVAEGPSSRPNYQEPAYKTEIIPSEIQYGFKPSYNKDIPRVQAPRRPKYESGSNPNQYRPDYSDQEQSLVGKVANTVYNFVSTTIAPYVNFGSSNKAPAPAPQSYGSNYPGKPGRTPEVASVIPSGFTSATLSNGPHSVPEDDNLRDRPVPGKSSTGNSYQTINFGESAGARPVPNSGAYRPAPRPNPAQPAGNYNAGSGRPSGAYPNTASRPGYPGNSHSTSGNRGAPTTLAGRPEPVGRPAPKPSSNGYNGRPAPGYNGRPAPARPSNPYNNYQSGSPAGPGGYNARPGPQNGAYNGRPGPNSSAASSGRPGYNGPAGNGNNARPGYNGKPGPSGPAGNGNGGRPGYNGNPGPNGPAGNGNGGRPGYSGRPGPNGPSGNNGRPGYNGKPGPNGPSGNGGRPGYNGRPGPNGPSGRPGYSGPGGKGGNRGPPGPPGRGGYNGKPGPSGNGGYNGRPGPAGYNGRPGPNGPAGNGGRPGYNGRPGSGGYSGRPGAGGYSGRPGNKADRQGKQFGASGITAVARPVKKAPAVLNKFSGSNWDKFGPGGFRSFNDTIGPEICQRPGLFRHPTECDKFYECYWDKWIEKYTVHVFPCPVVLGYDSDITACNWPFDGPQGQCLGKSK